MKNDIALNMREIADKVNEEAEAKKLALHRELVEQKIIPYLQEIAESGKYQAEFPVPGHNISMVRDILRKFGFAVDTYKIENTRHLLVRWQVGVSATGGHCPGKSQRVLTRKNFEKST